MTYPTWEERNQTAIDQARSGVKRHWYVLRIDGQKLSKAIDILPQLSMLAFAPTEQRSIKRRNKREATLKSFPLMSGYIVAGSIKAPNWFVLFQLPFVFSVVSRDGQPALIPDESMQRLWGIHQASTASLPGAKSLQPGDSVRILRGGFQGHEATLIDVTETGCEFLIDMFGKEHRVKTPITEIEAA